MFEELTIYDSVGKQLFSGDDVIVTKDLKVKGTQAKLKRGDKLKKIRLNDGIFSINCIIKGIGEIELKTESIKKCNFRFKNFIDSNMERYLYTS